MLLLFQETCPNQRVHPIHRQGRRAGRVSDKEDNIVDGAGMLGRKPTLGENFHSFRGPLLSPCQYLVQIHPFLFLRIGYQNWINRWDSRN